ncbi:TPA: hypothetical protein ACQ39K_004941 [Yersinia enterocolitica]
MKTNLAVLMGLLMMGASAGAMASASTPAGTLDMKAELTSATCTLVQKDLQADFGDIVKGVTPEFKEVTPTFQLENCGAAVQQVKATVSFTPYAAGFQSIVKNTGGSGDSAQILPFWEAARKSPMTNGASREFAIANGSTEVPVHLALQYTGHAAASLIPGSIVGAMSVTFEEQ